MKGNSLGSVGQFGWTGAAAIYAKIDPTERMALILLVHRFPYDQQQKSKNSQTGYPGRRR